MFMTRLFVAAAAVIASTAAMGWHKAAALPLTFSASGSNPASIQATVDAYRADLGTLNANAAGSFGSGRREINWDGVLDGFSAPSQLPANFFNVNSPRGVVFTSGGGGFEVSSTAASGVPVRFGNIDPSYTAQFQTFSAQRLFTPLGTNVYDVTFFVPGTTTAALTRGFGAVFADVDFANTSSIAFFDVNNALLDTLFVPAGPDGGLSFLGADYGVSVVSRVRVTSGNAALGAIERGNDLVVVDDFVFAEPVPEPGTLALLAMGTIGLGLTRRRRRG